MNDCLVIYASMSQVKRVQGELEKNGGRVNVTRTPHCISTGGCSTAIRCKQGQLSKVVAASATLDIPVEAAYAELPGFDGPDYQPLDWNAL
ncbi:TPA: hypothetical protein DDW35_07440 [Candidatus Sumerlaeota bacterium]|jgi:hypothetical protein|nr:hypothetical protein [Candidatus Sumerlaeota bacterium]